MYGELIWIQACCFCMNRQLKLYIVGSLDSPFMDEGSSRACLNDPLLEELGKYSTWAETRYEQWQIANWTLSFKMSLFKLGLVDIPWCDRCQGASKMASHILLIGTQAVLRFRYLGHHFVKPGDFADVSFSRVLCRATESLSKGLHRRQAMVKFQGSLWCLSYCTVLYSALL